MIKELPFEKIIQIAIRYGADFAEVFAEYNLQTTIVCDNKRLDQIASFCNRGVGIRVIRNGHISYGSTTELTQRALLDLAKKVGEISEKKRRLGTKLTLVEKEASSINTVLKHPLGTTLDAKCEIVTRASDTAWKIGKEIRQVKIVYRDTLRKTIIANSDGIIVSDEQVDTIFATHVIASQDGKIQTGYEPVAGSVGFEIFDSCPPEEIAECAAKRAIKMLSAKNAPSGQMPAILSSEAGGTMIHESVGHGLESDLASENLSVYSGKLGQNVASPLISVVDDAMLIGKRGSFSFDDEGNPAARTLLIDHGVLMSYLSPSTGNGRRQNFEYPPIVRMTNTFILPGSDDPAAILANTQNGIFVKKMGGGQVNTINGDFVFDVQEAYLIEGGKIAEPVRGTTLIGNGPKILCEIDLVGNDLGFSIGTCGKDGQEVPVSCGQPTLRIPNIVVGGTK